MEEQAINPAVINNRYHLTYVIEHSPTVLAALAYDTEKSANNSVFIKVKAPNNDEKKEEIFRTADRIKREADVLESLQHPGIPRLLDTELEGEHPYIVTEHKPGGIRYLEEWFKKYPAVDLAVKLGRSALEILEDVHEHDIVHRDVKTKNLLMQWGGAVSLVDFELALCKDERVARSVYASTPVDNVRITQTGSLIGTFAYMSPETIRCQPVTSRSDIYSMGIVLYELLYGKLPFEGDNSIVMLKQLHHDVNLWDPNGRRVPQYLIDILHRATAKEPEDRYESAGAMREDLERFIAA